MQRTEDGLNRTLTLPQTVYGGTLDAVAGEGAEKWKVLTLDGQNNKFVSNTRFWNLPTNSAIGIGDWYLNNIFSSHFNKKFGGNQSFGFLYTTEYLMDGLFASINELNNYLVAQYAAGTPVQLAYKLTESVPFMAAGGQAIPALAGVNTLLTDADTLTVTGRADPIRRMAELESMIKTTTN